MNIYCALSDTSNIQQLINLVHNLTVTLKLFVNISTVYSFIVNIRIFGD